jgi:hypothetical protein
LNAPVSHPLFNVGTSAWESSGVLGRASSHCFFKKPFLWLDGFAKIGKK